MLKNAINCIQTVQSGSFRLLLLKQSDNSIFIVCFQEAEDYLPNRICVQLKIWKVYPNCIQACSELLDCTRHKQHYILYIDDIQATGHYGMGSLLMEGLLLYARQKGIQDIWGDLQPTDMRDHKERLFAFYQKYGFKITDTENPLHKKIHLQLS
jgi:hypothetical protein